MPSSLLTQFLLPIDLDTFVDLFWENGDYFETFLSKYLEDLSVDVGTWEKLEQPTHSASSSQIQSSKQRQIRSYHPSKVSFPGLPSHAESLKSQTMSITKVNGQCSKFAMKEINTFRGIPYADYFSVNTEWIVSTRKQGNLPECSIDVFLEVQFYKSTWLQGTIESNTRAELITVYDKWQQVARQHIKQRQTTISPPNATIQVPLSPRRGPSRDVDASLPKHDENKASFLSINEDESLGHLISYVSEGRLASKTALRDVKSSSSLSTMTRNLDDYLYGSDDELLFYDCEDGGDKEYACSRMRNKTNPTPQELHDLYATRGGHQMSIHSDEDQSSHALAVNVVETIIVLAQFSYWKAHRLYMYDLKDLFNVNPSDVIARIFNSFLPGWHSVILQRPDMYGPILAVFMLPQALLLNMDTSRHGCSQSSVLGNATAVSICLWLVLSSVYRILTSVIAPSIEMRHCLSMMGYSFFAWNVALICTYPLERYHDLFGLPVALPIVLFGIPSAVAQGYMFWEHTPASSLTLQPAAFPTSLQHFAQNNSRWLQKVLWAVPKILAFLIVTGTHYQFLWYVARVFLPGRKQQCELSALMQPAQYADIITQKELRKYAVMLVSGRKEDDE